MEKKTSPEPVQEDATEAEKPTRILLGKRVLRRLSVRTNIQTGELPDTRTDSNSSMEPSMVSSSRCG